MRIWVGGENDIVKINIALDGERKRGKRKGRIDRGEEEAWDTAAIFHPSVLDP